MRKLLLLSILFLTPLSQAEDKQKLNFQLDITFTGEIIENSCDSTLSQNSRLSLKQVIKTLSKNCTINTPTNHPISKVKVTAFKPTAINQTSKSANMLKRYSFLLSEYI